jgi:hypothetical protein
MCCPLDSLPFPFGFEGRLSGCQGCLSALRSLALGPLSAKAKRSLTVLCCAVALIAGTFVLLMVVLDEVT